MLAAAVAVCFIVSRLLAAATPVLTAVTLANSGPVSITVGDLQVGDAPVLREPWSIPPGRTDDPVVTGPLKGRELEPGRPVDVMASITAPRAWRAHCTLEPRPPGACEIKVNFLASQELVCEYVCKREPPKE
jgi:hypothetical protein